jgi:hypothetical protein
VADQRSETAISRPAWQAYNFASDGVRYVVERRIDPPRRTGTGVTHLTDVICEVSATDARYGEPARTAQENAQRIADALNEGDRRPTATYKGPACPTCGTDNPPLRDEPTDGERKRLPPPVSALGPLDLAEAHIRSAAEFLGPLDDLECALDFIAEAKATGDLGGERARDPYNEALLRVAAEARRFIEACARNNDTTGRRALREAVEALDDGAKEGT